MVVNAFVITLHPLDSEHIQAIRHRLSLHGFEVTVVEGINGAELKAGDYFRKTLFWRSHAGHVMTPSELGCTLSHQKALRMAANSTGNAHLILEDDFEVSDSALKWIRDACSKTPEQTLLHLGSQEGLGRYYRFLRGKPSEMIPGATELRIADLEFLNRTGAYIVDKKTAEAMASIIEEGPFVIDKIQYWHERGAVEHVWFRWVVSHPTDLKNSTIENDRRAIKTVPWQLKSLRDLTYRRRMQLLLVWRKMSTHPKAFLQNQQNSNQLP